MTDETEACTHNLEMITESNIKFNKEAQDLCQRLNGQLMTPKQDDEAMMDKTLSDYILARSSENIIIKGDPVCIWLGAETGKLGHELVFTSMQHAYLVNSINNTVHKIKQIFRMKRPVKSPDRNDRLRPSCGLEQCSRAVEDPLICVFTREPTFTLSGLCKDSFMDRQFKLAGDITGGVGCAAILGDYQRYVGPTGWIISRSTVGVDDRRWRITHPNNSYIMATMMDKDLLPVGRHAWMVEDNICSEAKASSHVLQLSGCYQGQFTCHYGRCLHMSQRCNDINVRHYFIDQLFDLYLKDCDDLSDEQSCQTIHIDHEKYKIAEPPPRTQNKSKLSIVVRYRNLQRKYLRIHLFIFQL